VSLPPGTRIGAYEVLGSLGAGGMGEVYRAKDSKLKREVALKVLPADVANDRERMARFQREAEVLASLNHPHIAQIYGLEENALVMELVEGEDLAERLKRGAIPIDEALPIAKQIAEALEAAHEQGIIHRDLKPANIKVRPDGTVKVLDFGLAKALESGSGSRESGVGNTLANSPTITSPAMTMHGMILGTAAYMAPEQAKGKAVDKRADIWAFGVVLFEMLTGTRAFKGEDITDIITSVMRDTPDWGALPPATPPAIRTLLERCLLKDPRLRLRDIGDARLFLDDRAPAPGAGAGAGAGSRSKWVPVLAAGLAVAVVGLAASLYGGRGPAGAVPMHLSITFADGSQPQKGQPMPSLALSPDGRTLVYTAGGGPEGTQLWLRHLDNVAPIPIPGTGGAGVTTTAIARQVFFSPDGKWIGFVVGGNVIKKVPITLGPATTICDVFEGVRGATWTDRNEIVYAVSSGNLGLWRVADSGGTPVRVADGVFYGPDALPGGTAVLVTTGNNAVKRSTGDLTVAAVTLETGAVTKLFDGGTFARYVPTGHVVFARDSALMAAPFDAASLVVGDARTKVVDDLWMDPAVASSNYALSASGTLVYAAGTADEFQRTIVALDGDRSTPLVKQRRYYAETLISPTGDRIAAVERALEDRIWIIDLARETFTPLTSGRVGLESDPVWAPSGREIAFDATVLGGTSGLYVAAADGSQTETLVYASNNGPVPTSWTRDGRQLVFTERNANTGLDLMLLSRDQGNTVRPLLQTPFDEGQGVIARDGALIAFQSGRSGRAEIYVSPFPSMQGATQVSIDGGQFPVWATDRRRLYYRNQGQVMAVDLAAGVTGASRPISVARFVSTYPTAFVDPMPDGRFLALEGPNAAALTELRVIVNWFTELRDKTR